MVMKAWAMGKGRLSGVPDSKHSFIRERPCFPQNRQTYRSRCSGTSTSCDHRHNSLPTRYPVTPGYQEAETSETDGEALTFMSQKEPRMLLS